MKEIFSVNSSEKLSKAEKELLKENAEKLAESKAKLLREKDLENTLEGVEKYNYNLSKIDPILSKLTLPSGKILIRLHKQPKVTASGLYIPSTITGISENTGKLKLEAVDSGDDAYCSRATIVAVSADSKLKPGTIVDLYMNVFNGITQYWSPLDRYKVTKSTSPENYFTIPETHINFIWTN